MEPMDTQVELDRLEQLWESVFPLALTGDPEAQALSLRLSEHRMELQSRAAIELQSRVSPTVAIGDAWRVLTGGAVEAAENLLQMARTGKGAARVAAAQAVLSRVGIPNQVEVSAGVRMQVATMEDSPADPSHALSTTVRARLDALRKRPDPLQIIDAVPDVD